MSIAITRETAAGQNRHRTVLITGLGLCLLFLAGMALRLFRLDSVPIGGHGDVSWNGIVALDWLRYGVWPLYVRHLGAPEPGIMYLTGLSILQFGTNFFAARYVTSLASGIAVLLVYKLVIWLANPDADRRRVIRTAWLAALAYAVSFYPIILAKSGQRAQTFPMWMALLAALVAYGWRRGKTWAFIAAGVTLAIADYTYIPARFVPIMLGLWAAHQFFADRETFKARLRPFLLMLAVTIVLILPQIVMYIQTPEAFFARADETAGRFIFNEGLSASDLIGKLASKTGMEFAIFFTPWHGAYSEMDRALLELPLAAGAVIALIAALRRWKDRSLWWPLLALPMMIFTDVLSGTQLSPHGLRMIGIMPFAILLGARGIELAWGWLEQRVTSPAFRPVWGWAAAALIVVPALADLWTYHFQYIPTLQEEEFVSDRLEATDVFMTDLVKKHQSDGTPILITLDDFTRSNIVYLLSDAYPERRSAIKAGMQLDVPDFDHVLILWPDHPQRPRHDANDPEHDNRSWIMLVDGQMLILPPLTAEAGDEITARLAEDNPLDTVSDWQENRVAGLYDVPLSSAAFDLDMIAAGGSAGKQINLVGYQIDSQSIQPGSQIWVTLYWQAAARIPEEHENFVQLLDQNGNAVAGVHRWVYYGMYQPRIWRMDEIVPIRVRLDFPADLPVGPYTLITDFYYQLQNRPLEVFDAAGTFLGDHIQAGRLKVARPADRVTLPSPEQPVVFGGSIELAGIDVARAPNELTINVDWQAVKSPDADHTLFFHVAGPDGQNVAQIDVQPLGGAYPTGIWSPSEVIHESYRVTLPDSLAAGTYTVYVGWYTWPSLERLAGMAAGERVQDDRVPVYTFVLP